MHLIRLPAFFIALLFMLPFTSSHAEDNIAKHVDVHQFTQLIADNPNAEILDVRTHEEFHAGHIADAVLLDFYGKDFAAKVQELDKDKTYLLYCRSGNRSGRTLVLMKNLGFKTIYNMRGGMNQWTAAKLPVVTP